MSNQEYADGLRAVANFYEQNPEITIPGTGHDNFAVNGKEQARLVVKAIGKCDKEYTGLDKDMLTISGNIGGLKARFIFMRADVCERVVVGTKTIPAQIVPAREAQEIPERVIEEVEWHCGSILASQPVVA